MLITSCDDVKTIESHRGNFSHRFMEGGSTMLLGGGGKGSYIFLHSYIYAILILPNFHCDIIVILAETFGAMLISRPLLMGRGVGVS